MSKSTDPRPRRLGTFSTHGSLYRHPARKSVKTTAPPCSFCGTFACGKPVKGVHQPNDYTLIVDYMIYPFAAPLTTLSQHQVLCSLLHGRGSKDGNSCWDLNTGYRLTTGVGFASRHVGRAFGCICVINLVVLLFQNIPYRAHQPGLHRAVSSCNFHCVRRLLAYAALSDFICIAWTTARGAFELFL